MTEKEIIEKLTSIFEDIFELEDLTLTKETQASDIEEWDSLTHVLLVVEIEKKFKLKFTSSEIQKWSNVGDIIESLASKIG